LEVNGKKIEEINYDGLFVYLPWTNIKLGENSLSISFEAEYANNGEGLHSFIDID
jgi:hypothetical protein